MPPTKENNFLKRYLEAAHINESNKSTTGSTSITTRPTSVSVSTDTDLNLTDAEIDEIMAAEILPLLQTILSRLDKIETKIASGGDGGGAESSASSVQELPRSIRGFDSYMASFVDPFVAAVRTVSCDTRLSQIVIIGILGE